MKGKYSDQCRCRRMFIELAIITSSDVEEIQSLSYFRLQLDPDIICRRGLLTDIMTTPYLLQSKNKDGWSITAIKYDNKIFLLKANKPDETWGTVEERQLSTYTGSKFEQYVSKSRYINQN